MILRGIENITIFIIAYLKLMKDRISLTNAGREQRKQLRNPEKLFKIRMSALVKQAAY